MLPGASAPAPAVGVVQSGQLPPSARPSANANNRPRPFPAGLETSTRSSHLEQAGVPIFAALAPSARQGQSMIVTSTPGALSASSASSSSAPATTTGDGPSNVAESAGTTSVASTTTTGNRARREPRRGLFASATRRTPAVALPPGRGDSCFLNWNLDQHQLTERAQQQIAETRRARLEETYKAHVLAATSDSDSEFGRGKNDHQEEGSGDGQGDLLHMRNHAHVSPGGTPGEPAAAEASFAGATFTSNDKVKIPGDSVVRVPPSHMINAVGDENESAFVGDNGQSNSRRRKKATEVPVQRLSPRGRVFSAASPEDRDGEETPSPGKSRRLVPPPRPFGLFDKSKPGHVDATRSVSGKAEGHDNKDKEAHQVRPDLDLAHVPQDPAAPGGESGPPAPPVGVTVKAGGRAEDAGEKRRAQESASRQSAVGLPIGLPPAPPRLSTPAETQQDAKRASGAKPETKLLGNDNGANHGGKIDVIAAAGAVVQKRPTYYNNPPYDEETGLFGGGQWWTPFADDTTARWCKVCGNPHATTLLKPTYEYDAETTKSCNDVSNITKNAGAIKAVMYQKCKSVFEVVRKAKYRPGSMPDKYKSLDEHMHFPWNLFREGKVKKAEEK
ncbi:unnamed protein product [Amoebophrya sp. A120]|nr:unnamed protein product [Amoebophrya sp. A120]|eukprot:GSA120T00017885001.1